MDGIFILQILDKILCIMITNASLPLDGISTYKLTRIEIPSMDKITLSMGKITSSVDKITLSMDKVFICQILSMDKITLSMDKITSLMGKITLSMDKKYR